MAGTGITYNVKIEKGVEKWGTDFEKSLFKIGHPEAMTELAKGYRYYINKFVPKRSGALRRSARALGVPHAFGTGKGNAWVSWGLNGAKEYAHYQFVGDVYGPNKAIFEALGPNKDGPGAGVQSGWRSPKGKKKWNTGRKMGIPFTKTLSDGRVVRVLGYTTPNTKYDWINEFKKDKGNYGETAVNIRAGRFMYEYYCVMSHTTGHSQKANGGYAIYHSWRQIANIRD